MHTPLLLSTLAILLLTISSATHAAPAVSTSPDMTYARCEKPKTAHGVLPTSDFYAAAGKFLEACVIKPRPEVFPNMLDLASRDPKNPTCKVYASAGRVNLAVCLPTWAAAGEEQVKRLNKAFPTCGHAVDVWKGMMRKCPEGEMVEVVRPYYDMGAVLYIYGN
ncbi:uncharacterized protein H6S33_004811 [Morchella sextelata]|uniref:uncharacterized protein n=1 Tax=Morchella sextelata TaxID=1174677 RepID=UPI001D04EB61|nr:uncharacterized protein H6S33_004811 [Morchella sextelata]KAH0605589.1 hypothetical protein H6S33_004811 [Morchella sextelata]